MVYMVEINKKCLLQQDCKSVEFLLNFLEVSPQAEPCPEAGARSVEDKEKTILHCSVHLLVTGPVESFLEPDTLLLAVSELLWD